MANWKEYKLGDIADVQNGYAFKSSEFANSGVPIIKIKNIVPPSVDIVDVAYYSQEVDKRLEKFIVKKRDFLISMTGSTVNQMASAVGKMGRYPLDTPALINQRVGKIYSTSKNVSNEYLYYYLNRFEIQFDLATNASGSANQANISPDQIKAIKILLPNIKTQTAIAEILSSLDDKIELNNQINKELEALAQALFKQWFIDFEFPDENGQPYKSSGGEMVESELGEIPKGWRVDTLQELLEVKYGKDHKHLIEGMIPVYGSGGIMRYCNEPLYTKHSILIPRKGTLSNLFYVSSPFWSVDTMFYTIINEDYLRKYLYYTIKSLNLASMNVGSAVPSMTTKVLNELKIIRPDEGTLVQFENTVSSIFEYSDSLKAENQQLESLRDTLLPKLISGELEVQNV